MSAPDSLWMTPNLTSLLKITSLSQKCCPLAPIKGSHNNRERRMLIRASFDLSITQICQTLGCWWTQREEVWAVRPCKGRLHMTWKWTLLTNRKKIGVSFFRIKNWCRLTNSSFSPQEKILLFSREPRLISICPNPRIGSKAFWISQLSSIDLAVWVPIQDLIQLKTWQPGEIALSGSPHSIIRISWI